MECVLQDACGVRENYVIHVSWSFLVYVFWIEQGRRSRHTPDCGVLDCPSCHARGQIVEKWRCQAFGILHAERLVYVDTVCMVFSALVACTVYKWCMNGGMQLLFYCN